jgi:hypothetical protein
MLFINTAIALTFLPAILSAPASSKSSFRYDFEDDSANEFSADPKAPMGKGASSFDDKDDWESDRIDGVDKNLFNRKASFDAHGFELTDEEDLGLGSDLSDQKDEFDDEEYLNYQDNDEDLYRNAPAPKYIGSKTEKKTTSYVVIVKTGDKLLSGTGARVFLQFSDAKGNAVSGFLKGRFKHKSVRMFRISTDMKLDDVCKITIGSDYSGMIPQW